MSCTPDAAGLPVSIDAPLVPPDRPAALLVYSVPAEKHDYLLTSHRGAAMAINGHSTGKSLSSSVHTTLIAICGVEAEHFR